MSLHTASIPHIVSQFIDHCAGLWLRRELVARSLTYTSTFEDLHRLDERIDAQLDGVRATGEAATGLLNEALEDGGAGELFTAAVLAFESPAEARLTGSVLRELDKNVDYIRTVGVALDWINPDHFPGAINLLSRHGSDHAQAVVLSGWGCQGTRAAAVARISLSGNRAVVQRAACEAAANTGSREICSEILNVAEESTEGAVRLAAARAALLLGTRRAARHLTEIALEPANAAAGQAAESLFRYMEPGSAAEMHRQLFADARPSRTAVKAAGASGVVDLIPFLLDQLDNPRLARLSLLSIQAIAGLDPKERGLTKSAPITQVAGDAEDPDDESTDLNPDEGLPWPERKGVEAWWRKHSATFVPGIRYLWGEPVSDDMLSHSLKDGLQQRRAAAAELRALRGCTLFDVFAPAFRQVQRMQAL